MKKNQKMICVALGAMLLWPVVAQADIIQRHVFTAISNEKDSKGADVLTVAESTACGGNQLRIKEGMLENKDEYASLRPALAERIRDKTAMVVTLFGCPVGKAGDEAIPFARMMTDCGPDSCPDGKARLYLDEQLMPQVKHRSPYVLVLPLPKAALPGTWKVEIFDTIKSDLVRISGQTNAADFVSGKMVGGYRYYDRDGNIKSQVELDEHGRQHGVATTYFSHDKLESQGQWRDGQPVGVQNSYHLNGKVSIRQVYSDKGVLLSTQQFNEQGVLVYSSGQKSKK
ncbi:toxin-antitoxin system YwqK family antitoxin [Janthinobacterium kumbetense]|uniref:MORN repeat variant n=1 Tax=Janthinobacterium kumbetense TaxID=2950280 RepID=A0ABT0WMD0_9BURK|nr:hypothetical protein [Janthinobacterium kumbetense]MCM2565200.1 hypothetical protein [Janthinobacterium kumbetense]